MVLPLSRAEDPDEEQAMILAASCQLAGREIESEPGIVSAEAVFGMDVFRDFPAGIRDFVGGRSESTRDVLRDARRHALAELEAEAMRLGADAVIAVDLDCHRFSSGGSDGMIMLAANGTAVRLKA